MWIGNRNLPSPPRGLVEGAIVAVGGPCPGAPRAVSGTVIATTSVNTQIEIATTPDGKFPTELGPGMYSGVGHSPTFGNGKYECTAGGPVIVRANSVAHVTLTFSSR